MSQELLFLCVGILIGFLSVWLIQKTRTDAAKRELEALYKGNESVLQERLQAKEREVQAGKEIVVQAQVEVAQLRARIDEEVQRRSAAEEKNKRLGEVEELLKEKDREISNLVKNLTEVQTAKAELNARLEAEKKAASEKLALIDQAQKNLSNAFESLSSAALKSNNQAFLQLAKETLSTNRAEAAGEFESRKQAVAQLIAPLADSLKKVDEQIHAIELDRKGAYEGLSEQVKHLASAQQQLQSETGKLVKALRAPTVRGRWGEIQLQRVVEMAGMLEYCDFVQQETVNTEDGRLRPDLIVRLPGQKNIVVEAKAPLQAYLDALEAPDEDARTAFMKDHSRQIRDHIAKLSAKAYWDQFSPTPEFVVMFLPGETFFSAALQEAPGLIEEAIKQNVIVASPTTLIALLRAVAYGWRQERIAASAQEISNLGKELYDRLRTLAAHFEGLGKNLDHAVEAYNKAVGSFERMVLVSARKFVELGAVPESSIDELPTIERTTRALQAKAGEK